MLRAQGWMFASLKALGDARPTTHYVWRTAGDNRVRSAHAAQAGQIFSWATPPETGHPGTTPNCRCWPEPYYGNPAIPDALLPLQHSQPGRAGSAPWTSAERLTRPDGSLAESVVMGDDGTRIRSTFAGTTVNHAVTLSDGQRVRIEKRDGVQAIYLGDDTTPLQQSVWTASGPVVVRTRPRSAFQINKDPLNNGPLASWDAIYSEPGPGLGGGAGPGAGGLAAVVLALIELYNRQRTDPASMGAGKNDISVIAFKAWEVDAQTTDKLPVPVSVNTLSEEQLRQSCKRLPDVQGWTDFAAAKLAPQRLEMNAQNWGTKLHKMVKDIVTALQEGDPVAYSDIFAELSLSDTSEERVFYGQKGSTRLDVFENRAEEIGAVCVYDIKTGNEGLTLKRVKKIAETVTRNYGAVIFYIIEVRPTKVQLQAMQ